MNVLRISGVKETASMWLAELSQVRKPKTPGSIMSPVMTVNRVFQTKSQ
jgi:hypothetical protein